MRAGFELGIVLDARNALTLQHQLRRKLVDAMESGALPPGSRLPSSRRLAEEIGVSRNTVALAYDSLLAEGYLSSRPRSGVYVTDLVGEGRVATATRRTARRSDAETEAEGGEFRRPPNWHQYPYPFLDGSVEPALLPLDEWREALRLASGKPELLRFAQAGSETDDPALIDELRTKLLPIWGIDAAPDEVLVVPSMRHALFLALEALIERGATVLTDEALDSDTRRRLGARQVNDIRIERDAEGPILPAAVPPRSVILLGARRLRQGRVMSPARGAAWLEAAARAETTVVECAPPVELREAVSGLPSLRSVDAAGRVLFVGGLAPAAAIGAPPAFMQADPRIIARVRELRRSVGAEFAPGMQRAWSHFLALGHYGAAVKRISGMLTERRTELRDALNHYLHKFVQIGLYNRSSAHWVRGPAGMNSLALSRAAASHGVLIEPGGESDPQLFTMGVTSLPKDRIRAGVLLLARLIARDPALGSRRLAEETRAPLQGAALRRAIGGKSLLYNTVWGEPCTLEIQRGGTLAGRVGYHDEERDTGVWRVEGDRWIRQWRNWAYGESLALHVIIDGDQVRWYNLEGVLIDTAVIVRA
ncbi:MAG: hypothetical protein CMLOHMNK_03181 [Steroidobacteraceae bacterium]|nr:hypothetical protein [Steroidobacteraceae bacterium]